MSINPADPRTPAEQIADQLRDQIGTGALPPGARLPSERQLAERYGVSTTTAVRAIERLRDEGLVVSRPGAGRFVRVPRQLVRVGSDRYARWRRDAGKAPFQAEMEDAGIEWRQEILELAEVPADDVVAHWLNVEPGTPVWVRRRRTWAEGEPTQLADSFYRLEVVSGTAIQQENTGPGGGHARLEEQGYRISRFREEIRVRMPSAQESHDLHLAGGTPVAELHRITYSESGEVVEFFRSVMAGDRHIFGYEFEAPE
ncbi:GntR family transcriptional regulator [Actinokineospora enzanensis]|uniref:GntR family transcriptional regulator n=1 Tax=Actinokineospora enzanensis TaxID=155975 RepID=UPI000A078378|nr:GntR family transcriptional regulator [Actinokineospora enzanensis]